MIKNYIPTTEDLVRSFNIDRPDIKESCDKGTGTIAVPADRYKQYHDCIKKQDIENKGLHGTIESQKQTQDAMLKKLTQQEKDNAVLVEENKRLKANLTNMLRVFCPEDEQQNYIFNQALTEVKK